MRLNALFNKPRGAWEPQIGDRIAAALSRRNHVYATVVAIGAGVVLIKHERTGQMYRKYVDLDSCRRIPKKRSTVLTTEE